MERQSFRWRSTLLSFRTNVRNLGFMISKIPRLTSFARKDISEICQRVFEK